MKHFPYLCKVLSVLVALTLSHQVSTAQSSRVKFAPLSAGMTSAQVLQAWGVPDQKTLRETRRQERWDYGKRQVLFENGSVVRWRSDNPQANTADENAIVAQKHNSKAASAHPSVDDSSQLLDSILMDLPKDGGSEAAAAPNSGLPPGHPNPAEITTDEEEP